MISFSAEIESIREQLKRSFERDDLATWEFIRQSTGPEFAKVLSDHFSFELTCWAITAAVEPSHRWVCAVEHPSIFEKLEKFGVNWEARSSSELTFFHQLCQATFIKPAALPRNHRWESLDWRRGEPRAEIFNRLAWDTNNAYRQCALSRYFLMYSFDANARDHGASIDLRSDWFGHAVKALGGIDKPDIEGCYLFEHACLAYYSRASRVAYLEMDSDEIKPPAPYSGTRVLFLYSKYCRTGAYVGPEEILDRINFYELPLDEPHLGVSAGQYLLDAMAFRAEYLSDGVTSDDRHLGGYVEGPEQYRDMQDYVHSISILMQESRSAFDKVTWTTHQFKGLLERVRALDGDTAKNNDAAEKLEALSLQFQFQMILAESNDGEDFSAEKPPSATIPIL